MRCRSASASAAEEQVAGDATPARGSGEVVEVEEIKGVRVLISDEGNPRAEYLVSWKDDHPDTWETPSNLADNLLRDFEQRWWTAARAGDEDTTRKLLEGGGATLARSVDENGRSALHFAAGLGKVTMSRMLCEAGAEVDGQDKDGYTPMHMATGYLHTATMQVLLEFGTNPEVPDRQGRTALQLAENLRANMPANVPELISRRMALENCAGMLTDVLYEDVEPEAILEVRENEDGTKDYLVRFTDDVDDMWINEKLVSQDVINDYNAGLEYVEAAQVLDMRQRGDERRFLVRWMDDYPDSWEPEENVSADLVKLYLEQRQQRLSSGSSKQAAGSSSHEGHGDGGSGVGAAAKDARTPAAAGAM